jgi:ferredoxin
VKPKDTLARMDATTRREVYAPKGRLIPFGYFTVDAVVPHGFTDEAREELNKTLDIVQVLDDTPMRIVRACGSYIMCGGCVVRDTIEQIVDKAENIAKLHSTKLKWFVSGRFHEINATPIDGVKYGRGFYKLAVSIPKNVEGEIKTVRYIGEYSKKKYASETLDKELK